MLRTAVILVWLGVVHGIAPGSLAFAHDFWLEPAHFRPPPGQRVPIVIRVGENFSGTSQPFIPDWFSDYSATGPAGRQPVSGNIGDDPAGGFTPDVAGTWVVGYRSHVSLVELDPPKFDRYLNKEGLEWVIGARERRGDSASVARELFSRCAKALVRAGDMGTDGAGSGAGFDTRLGYTLELVPERDPYALAPGDVLPVQLLYAGEPLAGALLSASTAAQPELLHKQRTDADGRAEFTLQQSGTWLIKGVHIIELPPADTRADWESFWASLTFALGAP